MKPTEVARYLERTALDLDFRALARADPDSSFEGYALSDVEKEILRSHDHRMLGLLADALRGPDEAEGPPAEEIPAAPHPLPVTGRPLPPVELILRLVAVPSHDAEGEMRLAHVASLHAASAPGGPTAPHAADPEGAVGALQFRIVVAPHAAGLPDGRVKLTYAATIQAQGPDETSSATASGGGAPGSPREPRVASEAARRAAEAVKRAAPADRLARLLDLAAAIEGGGEGA